MAFTIKAKVSLINALPDVKVRVSLISRCKREREVKSFTRVFAVLINVTSAIRRPSIVVNQVVPFTGGFMFKFLTFTSTVILRILHLIRLH